MVDRLSRRIGQRTRGLQGQLLPPSKTNTKLSLASKTGHLLSVVNSGIDMNSMIDSKTGRSRDSSGS